MAGVVHIPWYATVLRHEEFGEAVAAVAPIALRYNATQYSVQRSLDDRYKILHMTWFQSKDDWYRFWEGPEMIEFRRRNSGRYQIPIVYTWHDEIAAGTLGPEVPLQEPVTEPEPQPQAAA
ncbi:MAG: hypothetical protein M3Z06_10140 [Actinomycetota bacterium]|nr:hypothetical protein [Actinomycetota bacterium]